MCSKLDKENIEKYLYDLLSSLKLSSIDKSWSVKDSAFFATTKYLLAFPKESEDYFEEYSTFWT